MEKFSQKRTKSSKTKYDEIDFSGIIGFEQFLDSDKRRLILNFFLSNEIINLVHDTLFLGKSQINSNTNSGVSSRVVSGKSKSISSNKGFRNSIGYNSKFNNTNNEFFSNPLSNINLPDKDQELFRKTTFPSKSNKLVSQVKHKKATPIGLSFNITGRIKHNNMQYYFS